MTSRSVIAAAVLVVAGISAALMTAAAAAGQSATTKAVQAVVLDALEAEQDLANLPATASQTGVSASLRGQMVSAAKSVIDRLYVGSAKDARYETIVGGLELEGTPGGLFVWDGGVHDVAFQSTSIDGSKATVVVQATSFLVMSMTQDGARTRPESTATHTFQLIFQDGRWYVSNEDLDFAPGQGP